MKRAKVQDTTSKSSFPHSMWRVVLHQSQLESRSWPGRGRWWKGLQWYTVHHRQECNSDGSSAASGAAVRGYRLRPSTLIGMNPRLLALRARPARYVAGFLKGRRTGINAIAHHVTHSETPSRPVKPRFWRGSADGYQEATWLGGTSGADRGEHRWASSPSTYDDGIQLKAAWLQGSVGKKERKGDLDGEERQRGRGTSVLCCCSDVVVLFFLARVSVSMCYPAWIFC
jgi:hypothetical protein